MKPWIRIDCDIGRNPKVWKLADSVGIPAVTTVGHLVLLFGSVRENRPHGDVADLPHALLESWAGWTGTPGAFASAFRVLFVNDDEISGWNERQGPVVREAEYERRRYQRRKAGDTPVDVRADSGRNPDVPSEATGTGTVVLPSTTTARAHEESNTTTPIDWPLDPPEPEWPTYAREAARDLAAKVPEGSWSTWRGAVRGMLDPPSGGPRYTTTVIGQAIVDFMANGAGTMPRLMRFRHFVRVAHQDAENWPGEDGKVAGITRRAEAEAAFDRIALALARPGDQMGEFDAPTKAAWRAVGGGVAIRADPDRARPRFVSAYVQAGAA